MSFTDDLKRSLGFEETGSNKQKNNGPGIMDNIREILKPKENPNRRPSNSQQQYRPAHRTVPNPTRPQPKHTPVYDDFDDFVITPEQSFYEIVLIRPKTIDDINYIVDQVIEEKNPVLLDLSFLENESPANFKLAGDKIKQMRTRYGAQALLLSRSSEKNLIILSPKKVKLVKKS